jgi:hypothetical protein
MLEKIRKNRNSLHLYFLNYCMVFVLIVSLFCVSFGNVVADGDNVSIKTGIENPLGDKITDIPSFIKEALEFIVKLGIPVITFAIIYTGFLFISAKGNKEKLTEAKKAMGGVLIGAAIILGAFVIAEAIGGTVKEIKNSI